MRLTHALLDQAGHCEALGSPFMARLLHVLAEVWPPDGPLNDALGAFDGDIGPKGHSIPLRLASALHALVLTRQDEALVAVYPPTDALNADLQEAVRAALSIHQHFILNWIKSPPQTNEVRRSAVLIAGAHWAMNQTGPRPVCLSELGASAGLNLMFDRYALQGGNTHILPNDPALTLSLDWNGGDPMVSEVKIADRRGVDLNPLDPHNQEDALRLRAFLWPDQPHRMDLTNAAIRAHEAVVDQGDAIDWLARRLDNAPTGHAHLITHTIAWQYFPAEKQDEGTRLIERKGATATADTPLIWLSMEADDNTRGAAVTARIWPGDITTLLARADFHGRRVDWRV